MISTTKHLNDFWAAAMEHEVSSDSGSDWLASLKVVMAALERTLQHEGRGAFVLLITPFGGLPQRSGAEDEASPRPKEQPSPPAG